VRNGEEFTGVLSLASSTTHKKKTSFSRRFPGFGQTKEIRMPQKDDRHAERIKYPWSRVTHVKPLFDAIYEFKDRTSDGGVRVYFIAGQDNEFYAFHAECKKESDADEAMLSDGIEILEALEAGQPVFPVSNMPQRWRERNKS
jgi:hypothetical protein